MYQDAQEAYDDGTALYGYLRAPSKWRAVIYQEQSIVPSLWTCSNDEQESAWSV